MLDTLAELAQFCICFLLRTWQKQREYNCMAHQMHPAVALMMKFPISPMASQEGVTYKTTSSKWRPW
jgi:hypothetical protein